MLHCVFFLVLPLLLPCCYSLKKVPKPIVFPNTTQHVGSLSLRISSSLGGTSLHYTLDGTEPSPEAPLAVNNRPIPIKTIGTFVVKAYATKEGFQDSDIASRRYNIMEVAKAPKAFPDGGTYAGSCDVILQSDTSNAMICYNINENRAPTEKDTCIENDSSLTLQDGQHTLKAIAILEGFGNSPVTSVDFNVLAKVVAPVITPSDDTFTISATLFFTSATANATLYFTTDGSTPTQSSLSKKNHESIVIEKAGDYAVKVFATESTKLPSDVVTKHLTILARLGPVSVWPPPGHYVGDTKVRLICAEQNIWMRATRVQEKTMVLLRHLQPKVGYLYCLRSVLTCKNCEEIFSALFFLFCHFILFRTFHQKN